MSVIEQTKAMTAASAPTSYQPTYENVSMGSDFTNNVQQILNRTERTLKEVKGNIDKLNN